MDPAKLKVVDLRSELSSRGLDTKGNKAALIERLQEALDKESQSADSKTQGAEEGNCIATEPVEKQEEDMIEHENDDDVAEGVEPEVTDELSSLEKSEVSESEQKEETLTQENESTNIKDESANIKDDSANVNDESADIKDESANINDESANINDDSADIKDDSANIQDESTNNTDESANIKEEPAVECNNEEQDSEKTEMEVDEQESPVKKEGFEEEVKPDVKIKTENIEGKERDSLREDRKRKRSRSSSPRRDHSRSSRDEEPELNDNAVTLSWYDSDLNLIIEKDGFTKASPKSTGGFGFIWAGARSTFGYVKGKLCYQVKLSEFNNVSHLENEPNPNVVRVGWSVFDTSLQLGEEPLSFGYGGTGKISVNCKFQDYGKTFGLNDVVTAYIDFNDGEISMSYAVNDEFLGEAFKISEEELKGKALAPHILSKNVKFEVNFGQEEPWVPVQEGYTFSSNVPIEEAVAGPRRPEKMGDCEMLMMCGLPGAGKTYWANKHCAENPDKRYNILGTNALIDKMKVMGLPRKANYSGRWDLLIEKCTTCLQRLMYIGSKRWRNYILDQTNVYPAAQRRKMRNFDGFVRKAVVIVPTDEEFTRRVNERERVEGKDVPDSAVMEMKANFTLPDKSIFDEIIYTELDESEARKMVNKYNDEAVSAGYAKKIPQQEQPPSKRFRGDFRQSGGGDAGGRHDRFRSRGPPPSSAGGFRRGGSGGGSIGSRGSGGGFGNRGNSGGWQRQGGGGDRWRDNDRGFRSGGGGPGGGVGNRGSGAGGWQRQGGGGGDRWRDNDRGPRSGGGWRQNPGVERGPPRDRGYEGGDRNRMGGGNNDRNSRMGAMDRNSRMGGNDRNNRMGGGDRNRIGDERNNGMAAGGFDRNHRGGAGRQQVQQQGGGGYNRNIREDNRPKGGIAKREVGSASGNVSSSATTNNQWSGYQGQGGGSSSSGGGSQQGGGGGGNVQQGNQWSGQQTWPQQSQQQNQQWAGYQQMQQQQWKGYNQGYNQQTTAAGYSNNQQGSGYNTQQQGYGAANSWPQQYAGYGAAYNQQGWGQNWQNWYAQNGMSQQAATITQPPPPAK